MANQGPHITPVRVYLGVFATLMVLTALTVFVAFRDMGAANDLVAMTIAGTKAVVVILFFMHVAHSTRLTKIVVVSAFLWLLILVVFTMSDYVLRGWLGVPGR